ncbi:MAG: tetratricopeptide repeat protein [Deltaproteobacteria bacterium]
MRIRIGWFVCALLVVSEANAHEGAPLTLSRLSDATNASTLFERAESYRNLRRIDDALVALELVEALHPDETRVWLERGRLEQDRGQHAAAVAAFTKYLERDGRDVHGARLLRARSRVALGEVGAAMADYAGAVDAAPGVDAFYEGGRLLVNAGRRDEAAAWLARGVEATGSDLLVAELARVEPDPARAKSLIDARLRSARVKTRWLLLRAEVQSDASAAAADRRAAVEEAERLVARRPTPLALTERATAYVAVGRRTDAVADLRRALRRAPSFTRAQALLERIEGGAR